MKKDTLLCYWCKKRINLLTDWISIILKAKSVLVQGIESRGISQYVIDHISSFQLKNILRPSGEKIDWWIDKYIPVF